MEKPTARIRDAASPGRLAVGFPAGEEALPLGVGRLF